MKSDASDDFNPGITSNSGKNQNYNHLLGYLNLES